jgi:phage terminase small subunit
MEDIEMLKAKYPTPKPHDDRFTHYWNNILPDIADRENLKFSHLQELKILCSLYKLYDELDEELELEGRTYVTDGRNGRQQKIHPNVQLLKSTISEIRVYSNMLDLVLTQDKLMNNQPPEEANEFR